MHVPMCTLFEDGSIEPLFVVWELITSCNILCMSSMSTHRSRISMMRFNVFSHGSSLLGGGPFGSGGRCFGIGNGGGGGAGLQGQTSDKFDRISSRPL